MKHLVLMGLIASTGILPAAGAQTAPAQPQDPTMHAPSTAPNSGTPRSVPNAKRLPDEAQNPSRSESSTGSATHAKARPFMGTVVRQGKDYMLRAGDLEYKLDDPVQARGYEGKNVKVRGNLDRQNNSIHVQAIEASPSI
jgi:Protein of unknown function (DUF5818)